MGLALPYFLNAQLSTLHARVVICDVASPIPSYNLISALSNLAPT